MATGRFHDRPSEWGQVVWSLWLNEEIATATIHRLRFETPLYTVGEAARILGVPTTTLSSWVKGYAKAREGRPPVVGAPVVTSFPARRRDDPSIPFVGLAEAFVLAAMRRAGVALQRIRPALAELEKRIGVEHALASQRLYTDGAELLFDFAERHPGDEGESANDLVVVRNGQRVFKEVIVDYLQQIVYGADGYASLIRVPLYEKASVIVDPSRSFGAPIFERGAVRIDDVLHRFWAGESMQDLADDFRIPLKDLEDVVRVASRRAA